ncbi:MAG: hypothetical protein ACKOC5_10205 [Chloroflexota bacterium]
MNDVITITTTPEQLAELGRTYPAEYLTAMCCTLEAALEQWLSDHAPEQIAHLLDDLVILERVTAAAHGGRLSDQGATWLVLDLPGALLRAAMLGAEFHSPSGCSRPRQPRAGQDYDPNAPLCQDDYERLTHSGQYSDGHS